MRELKEKIRSYDAVLIATPEYDYAIPGVLTTALDWCLRRSSPLRHKPVGIAGASPSGAGTVLGQMVLRQILLHGPAYVMPEPRMLISNAYQRFDENGDLTDEETRQRLRRFLEALREWSASLARAGPPSWQMPSVQHGDERQTRGGSGDERAIVVLLQRR